MYECMNVKEKDQQTEDIGLIHLYSPIYKGKYRDKEYIFESDLYSQKVYKVGQKILIKINPNNPKEFIDPVIENNNEDMFFLTIFCIIYVFIFTFDLIKLLINLHFQSINKQ